MWLLDWSRQGRPRPLSQLLRIKVGRKLLFVSWVLRRPSISSWSHSNRLSDCIVAQWFLPEVAAITSHTWISLRPRTIYIQKYLKKEMLLRVKTVAPYWALSGSFIITKYFFAHDHRITAINFSPQCLLAQRDVKWNLIVPLPFAASGVCDWCRMPASLATIR